MCILWGLRTGGAAECSSPCHGEGRGFKSRPVRHEFKIMTEVIRPSEQALANKLAEALEQHAADSLVSNPSNAIYAEAVREKSQWVQELISSKSGAVPGVLASWMPKIVPVAELLFGEDFSKHPLGDFIDYGPTALDGVAGRLKIVSIDEIFGPTVVLDLAADTVKVGDTSSA